MPDEAPVTSMLLGIALSPLPRRLTRIATSDIGCGEIGIRIGQPERQSDQSFQYVPLWFRKALASCSGAAGWPIVFSWQFGDPILIARGRRAKEGHEKHGFLRAMRSAGRKMQVRSLLLLLPGTGAHPAVYGREILLPGLPGSVRHQRGQFGGVAKCVATMSNQHE